MSQNIRQRNLFAAEDFSVVYDSFKQSNFQAYDYDTIRAAMVDYIRINNPENYNDWIKSSEFVALIELVAFLGHNLAFRTDLGIRENFLSTAERRESVLRIADFLGYRSSRISPARGLLKIKSVRTNQNIYDSAGKSLKNKTVRFFDDNNTNTFQDFILVMNEVLSKTNRFGNPVDSKLVSGIRTEVYSLNNTLGNKAVFNFRSRVNGTQQPFEIHSSYISENSTIEELPPNFYSRFSILYRNDRQGIGSKETGFFMGFKQGTLSFQDYLAESPIPNLSIDINSPNITDNDVWVHNIDASGLILNQWTKVDNLLGASANFNNLDPSVRKIFSDYTRENDLISIKFPDGIFGDIPRGLLRIWYRQSLNQSYTLNADDVGDVSINVTYIGSDNNEYNANFILFLPSAVNNASSSESIESIKENASRVYYTQDRMITGEDYSVFPGRVSSNVRKIKSVNRTHSGHSRFIDINDPTAQYQNVKMISDDGYLYTQNILFRQDVNASKNLSEEKIFDLILSKILEHEESINFYYTNYSPIFKSIESFRWKQVTSEAGYSSGFIVFPINSIDRAVRLGKASQYTFLRLFEEGALVEFKDSDNNTEWARVVTIFKDGFGVDDSQGMPTGLDGRGRGTVILNKIIPDNMVVNRIFPKYNTKFKQSERETIISEMLEYNTFGIRYDYVLGQWKIIQPSNLANISPHSELSFSLSNAGNQSGNNLDDSWIIRMVYNEGSWIIIKRRHRIVFGSQKNIRFYNQNNRVKLNNTTNKPDKDNIMMLSVNRLANGDTMENIRLDVFSYFTESNGNTDDTKLLLSFADLDNDRIPDNPMIFRDFIGNQTVSVLERSINGKDFIEYDSTQTSSIQFPGRNKVTFQWNRIADTNQRIDPSISNVIDTFVLTRNYDTAFRSWLTSDRQETTKPIPPSIDELSMQFSNIAKKKSISDTVIYRGTRYKILFGDMADPVFQAKFRVVKSTGTMLNDGEIKTRVANAIRDFFDIDNWDFGETFYFTELAAYVHNKLAGIVASIVIVPSQNNSVFGYLFQITPESDELFIPDVSVSSIDIVNSFTESNLRIREN